MVRLLRVVLHDVHALAAEDVAAVVGVELDRLLRHHGQVARLVVGGEELLRVVALVHVLPPAAVRRLHEDRELQVVEDLLPVDPQHVAERLRLGVGGVVLVRKENGARHGHVDRLGHEVVEELVVGRPPDRVVHDADARAGGALQVGPIERDLVADAVEDQVVVEDAVVFDVRDLHRHGQDAVAAPRVDRADQRPGKRVLHAEQESDTLLHAASRKGAIV